MSKVRVPAFAISVDGFGAGPRQDLEYPLGVRGEEIMQWMFATEAFHTMQGMTGGAKGVENDFFARGFENVGAWIMGRNMFGPIRGPWADEPWKGWWGDNPPFHKPVFVLTHHARPTVTMQGGTTFHFITDGIDAALRRAVEAAQDGDIRIGGGVSVIRQYLAAGHIDEMHLAISPVLLGEGEHLFSGIDLSKLGYNRVRFVTGEAATHVLISKY